MEENIFFLFGFGVRRLGEWQLVSIYLRFRILILGLLFSLGLWIILTIVFKFELFRDFRFRFDGWMYDTMSRSTIHLRSFDKLIIIDVNDSDQKISRTEYAALIDTLINAEVNVIGFDLLFYEHKDPIADNKLAKAVEKNADKIVLAYMFINDKTDADIAALENYNLLNRIRPVSNDSAKFINELLEYYWDEYYQFKGVWLPFFSQSFTAESEMSMGHINYQIDYDGQIRHFPLILRFQDGYYPALALEIVKRYLNASYVISKDKYQLALQKEDGEIITLPLDLYGQLLMRLIHPDDIESESIDGFFKNRSKNAYKDAIVLIVNSQKGEELTDATFFKDQLYPEWAFHASLISQILDESFIRVNPADTFVGGEIIVLLSILWLLILEYRLKLNKRKSWIVLLIVNILYILITYVLLNFGVRLFVLVPLIIINLTYLFTRKKFYEMIKSPSFLDIELLIGKILNGSYQVSITRSPFGVASSSSENFINESNFKETLKDINVFQNDKRILTTVGTKLYEGLFLNQIQRIYDRCWAEAEKEKKILRLKMRIDADELSGLPWELLFDNQMREGFLGLAKQFSLVRHIHGIQESALRELNLPLKILVMISSPRGLAPLEIAAEKKEIKKALRSLIWLRDIQITFTDKATPEELEKHLERGVQIFHYIGHSQFEKQLKEGMLALEDNDGNLNWVEADRLAYLMQRSGIQIVILNSCESATSSESDGFSGISQKLINAGVPAVVAMQYPIKDTTAILFTKKFYNTFIEHFSIDEAVNQARRSLMAQEGVGTTDWSTPVLFSSVEGGWWESYQH